MRAHLVYTEEWYGGEDKIKIFENDSDATAYAERIGNDKLSVCIRSIEVEKSPVFLSVTEEWYGSIEVHPNRQEAQNRADNIDKDVIILELEIQ